MNRAEKVHINQFSYIKNILVLKYMSNLTYIAIPKLPEFVSSVKIAEGVVYRLTD